MGRTFYVILRAVVYGVAFVGTLFVANVFLGSVEQMNALFDEGWLPVAASRFGAAVTTGLVLLVPGWLIEWWYHSPETRRFRVRAFWQEVAFVVVVAAVGVAFFVFY